MTWGEEWTAEDIEAAKRERAAYWERYCVSEKAFVLGAFLRAIECDGIVLTLDELTEELVRFRVAQKRP